MHTDLDKMGWDAGWENALSAYDDTWQPVRVAVRHRARYRIIDAHGEWDAVVDGSFYGADTAQWPAVGDWVAVSPNTNGPAIIHAVLPRRSHFSRQAAGLKTEEQVVAANFSTVFVVSTPGYDLNPRRLERYLSAAWDSGAKPVVLLNKSDLCDDTGRVVSEVEAITPGVDIHAVSAVTGQGMDAMARYFADNGTAVLIGSSGVGKSSLINALAGEALMDTGDLRVHIEKGRHTTTHRELLPLPGGGWVIDTPGMRELKLWDREDGGYGIFEEIDVLAQACRFNDCRHDSEPGCAVREALDDGRLEPARFANYKKMCKELAYAKAKQDKAAQMAEKKKQKTLGKYRKSLRSQE